MVVGWLYWGLTSQSTIFQSCRDGAIASWVINQYFRGVKCLAQGHNTAAVGSNPRPLAPESDTLPLSHRAPLLKDSGYPHDGRADKNAYPHDRRADKDSYPHDSNNQCIILRLRDD